MTLKAVCAVLLSHTIWRENSDFAARWGCCREMSFLFFVARFRREILIRAELRWNFLSYRQSPFDIDTTKTKIEIELHARSWRTNRDVGVRRLFLGFCLRVHLLALLLDGPYSTGEIK